MAFLRHAPRHVHAALVDRITAGLRDLGWLTAGEVPFGGEPVRIKDYRPFVGDRLDSSVSARTVTISAGNEFAPALEEAGGPLSSQEYPFFVDVFMDTNGEATALTSDIRDLLLGRQPGYGRFLTLVNKATGTPVPDWSLELDDIERVVPEHAFPLQWQAVHLTVTAYFHEVIA